MNVWVIDLCEENLLRVAGAKEAAAELERRLELLFASRDSATYKVYRQACVKACRPCHQNSLIARVNNSLVRGETHTEAIEKILASIVI